MPGYFVRTNAKANRRLKGGWDNELDVLAFNPGTKELVHLETSWDALTWEGRKDRFLTKKFVFTDQQYATLVGHPPSKIRINRVSCGIDLIMPLSEPAMGCVASA